MGRGWSFVPAHAMSSEGASYDKEHIYPYFFLNVETIGVGGVAKWCAVLLAAFVAVGYLLLGIDRLLYGIRSKRTERA